MTLAPPEQVLSTLRNDGTRRWINPKVSKGRYLRRRTAVAWFLMALFFLLPFVRAHAPYIGLAGKPLFLLDIAARKFTLFGFVFLPTDTFLLALGMLFIFVSIFLFTAIFGRLWCGWACPQTVYLEFLYRPLQRLFEGTAGRGGPAKKTGMGRKTAYFFAALLLTAIPAHTFLAYFVGVENLARWMREAPTDHPTAFLVMAATTLLMFFDFYWFREQTCLIACPYGRFQSGLLDRQSLIVTYDQKRGEPRGKAPTKLPVVSGQWSEKNTNQGTPADHRPLTTDHSSDHSPGDCIDCHLCVATCPTGIDIRDGLQMECVNCTQCIDACDAVMDKISRPRGLIRYSSQAAMELAGSPGQKTRTSGKFRFRTVFYPTILLVLAAAWIAVFLNMGSANVTILRNSGTPYTIVLHGNAALIGNPLKLKITNRTDELQSYSFTLLDFPEARIEEIDNPFTVEPGASVTQSFLIEAPPNAFATGKHEVWMHITDGHGFSARRLVKLLGPMSGTPAESPAAARSQP